MVPREHSWEHLREHLRGHSELGTANEWRQLLLSARWEGHGGRGGRFPFSFSFDGGHGVCMTSPGVPFNRPRATEISPSNWAEYGGSGGGGGGLSLLFRCAQLIRRPGRTTVLVLYLLSSRSSVQGLNGNQDLSLLFSGPVSGIQRRLWTEAPLTGGPPPLF